MKFAAAFSLIVGFGMIVQWTMSYLNKQIPELKTEPIRIGFHLAGEMLTAVSLIISGIGLLIRQPWSQRLFMVASGMLIYTAVVSPGYFAQKGHWLWVGIFGFLITLSIISIMLI